MARISGFNVKEGKEIIIFVDLMARDFFVDYFTKKAVFHVLSKRKVLFKGFGFGLKKII